MSGLLQCCDDPTDDSDIGRTAHISAGVTVRFRSALARDYRDRRATGVDDRGWLPAELAFSVSAGR
jgi:hypothetical protein